MGPPPAPGTQSQPAQDVKPDPDDPLSQKILGPEVKEMRERLIDSATIMAQMVNHHTDVHKVGVQRQAPFPPRALKESWLRQSELYEELIDTVEIQLRRALAAVEYQIEQEQEKSKIKQEAEEMQKNGTAAGTKSRKGSMFIDIPRFDEMNIDPLTVHPEIKLSKDSGTPDGDTDMQDGKVFTEDPASMLDDEGSARIPSGAVVPKDPGLLRPSRSSISLTSLNRHGLKLDLSSITLDGLNDSKSALAEPRVSALGGISAAKGAASPVTLAPKSARPRDGDYLAMDLGPLNTFLNSSTDLNIEDLFGDSEMPFSESAVGDGTVGGGDGTASVMESFLSAQNLLPNSKGEDGSMDLLGTSTNAHANTTSAPTAEDSLFEEFGFVEVKNEQQPTASTSAAGAGMGTDLSSLGTFDFSNPSATADSNDFNMMGLDTSNADVQRLQQQQRQQFGLDLDLPTSLDASGVEAKMLNQYQTLLDTSSGEGGAAALSNFDFENLFGNTADGSGAAAGMDNTLDFNELFDDATSSSKPA